MEGEDGGWRVVGRDNDTPKLETHPRASIRRMCSNKTSRGHFFSKYFKARYKMNKSSK